MRSQLSDLTRQSTGARASRRPLRWVTAAAVLATAVLVAPLAAGASVNPAPETSAAVTGTVYAMARIGTRTIIAGDFTAVGGVARKNAAAIRADGTLDPSFKPNPNGIVEAIAVSADATRVFLGGTFTRAGGAPRANLAAVNATTGASIPTWYAATNGEVDALTTAGNVVYIAGKFTTVAGVTRRRIAALDATTRALQLGFNPSSSWTVRAITVSPDRTKVYAVGGFTQIGGAARKGIAELRSSNGMATPFEPTLGGVGIAVALSPDGSRVYFSTAHNRLVSYRPAKSNKPIFKWQLDGDVQAIAASATEIYFGGHFVHMTKGTTTAVRHHLGSVSLNGTLTAWDPGADGTMGVWSAVVSSAGLQIGGDFTVTGGLTRPSYARFSGTP
jgi:hypothetical protein